LQKQQGSSETGLGAGAVIFLIVLLVLFLVLAWKVTFTSAPAIQLQGDIKGIGQSTPVNFTVRDARHHLRRVFVEVRQADKSFVLLDRPLSTPSWWKFWSRAGQRQAEFSIRAGRQEVPELHEGRATLVFVATNDSWGRFFRGGRAETTLEVPVRFAPPSIEVLTTQHYINQGGCDMVLFKVSPGTVESGVQVGKYFFPSWPVKSTAPETRLCVFAYSYEVDPQAPARVVARDDAGNESLANFTYRVFPKKFKSDTLQINDEFMTRVVPPILSQSPEVRDQGSLLKNFLLINGTLRQLDAQKLLAFAQKTRPSFTWTQPFVPLVNTKVESAFADFRTYVYNGQVIDHQTHLGFDLAGVQHTPVVAANDGEVVFAGFLGIYGNAIVIDHGCGLQSLYGHLSSLNVKEGDTVKRGQVIGHTGQTGLAGGDHLHFTMLLDGIPVNPIEWWDPHWIHDRIEAKLQQ